MTRVLAGALTVLVGNMFIGERRRLVDLAAKNRLPTIYTSGEFVDGRCISARRYLRGQDRGRVATAP